MSKIAKLGKLTPISVDEAQTIVHALHDLGERRELTAEEKEVKKS